MSVSLIKSHWKCTSKTKLFTVLLKVSTEFQRDKDYIEDHQVGASHFHAVYYETSRFHSIHVGHYMYIHLYFYSSCGWWGRSTYRDDIVSIRMCLYMVYNIQPIPTYSLTGYNNEEEHWIGATAHCPFHNNRIFHCLHIVQPLYIGVMWCLMTERMVIIITIVGCWTHLPQYDQSSGVCRTN